MDAALRCLNRAAAATGGQHPNHAKSGGHRLIAAVLAAGSALSFATEAASDAQVNCVDFRVGPAIRVYAERIAPDGTLDPAWVPDPFRLCVGVGHEYAFSSNPDGQSALIVGWSEPGRGGSDIRVQRLVAGIGVSAGWPTLGIPACTATGDQYGPRATSDGAGGAFLVWGDLRSGRPRLFAQRVTDAGTIASGWPADGLAIGTGIADQLAPAIAADGSGGALITWHEYQSGLLQMRVVRITGNGAVAPSWPAAGFVPCPSSNHQLAPQIASDGAGGALVVWEERVDGEHKLRAARLTAIGALEAGWPATGLVLSNGAGQQRRAVIVVDDAGGAVVAWHDTRAGNGDIYAQRFTGAGTLASEWPAAGVALCSHASEQYAPAILGDGANGAFVAWEDFRAGTTDVFAQRVTGAGAVSAGWLVDGVALTSATGEQYAPRLMGDGAGGAIATWFDTRSFTGPPVAVQPPSGPRVFALYGPQPSPAVDALRIAFALPDDRAAKLELFDIAGRRVASRDVGGLGPGRHVVTIEPRVGLSAGVYVVRLTRAGRSLTATAAVLR